MWVCLVLIGLMWCCELFVLLCGFKKLGFYVVFYWFFMLVFRQSGGDVFWGCFAVGVGFWVVGEYALFVVLVDAFVFVYDFA